MKKDTQYYFLQLLANWGDLPIDEEGVKETLIELREQAIEMEVEIANARVSLAKKAQLEQDIKAFEEMTNVKFKPHRKLASRNPLKYILENKEVQDRIKFRNELRTKLDQYKKENI